MLSAQRPSSNLTTVINGETSHLYDSDQQEETDEYVRDIHALTPPHPVPVPVPVPPTRGRWETGSNPSQSLSMGSETGGSTENFTSMSREFNALVLAGSAIESSNNNGSNYSDNNDGIGTNRMSNFLTRIGENDHDVPEETNPLAIVPDNNPLAQDQPAGSRRMVSDQVSNGYSGGDNSGGEMSVQRVKKEEVETKISAWQNAKVSKINNRFKRDEAVINGWESEQIQKANSWMKKIERKLEVKRVRALEKMQNEVAKARRKAQERRASAEAKRGTKVASVFEVANLMRAVGRPPVKRSFF
ncbi:hypothetical protein K2173_022154 [Erythroxylum novogranatense]|uniref:Remorin C-terminal domain-containing protein n=1 Tax=Erythroxylum novogranatense TaxID=1862640 RepID=A0AAV8STI6_9ROSI|nr:hypothetical protein K2173_022154 [Erythroxylum novogranatense]